VIYGDDPVAASGKNLIYGENIAAKLTNNSCVWREAVLGGEDPLVKQWSRYHAYVAHMDKETIYGIPFDANGGTGAPESITVREGETITIPETAPSRAGYTFLGWASQPDAVSAEYRPGDRVTITESLTFYAVWENNSSEEDPEEDYLFRLLSGSDSAVTITLENNTGMGLQAMAVVAVYDREGRMIACETTEEGTAIESWQTLTVTFSESDGAEQVLAFLMDANTGRPLCPVWRRTI